MPKDKKPKTRENENKKLKNLKKFSATQQPSGKAKSAGKARAKAKKKVLELICEEFINTQIETILKDKDGKETSRKKLSAFQCAVQKLIKSSTTDPEVFLKVVKMISDFEMNTERLEFDKHKEAVKNGDDDEDDTDNSFIEALNASTEEIWGEDEKTEGEV